MPTLRKPNRPQPLIAAAIAALVTLLLFLPACAYPFANLDDFWNIAHNPNLNPNVTLASVLRFWRGAYLGLYSPITYSIWAACAALGRLPTPIATIGQSVTTLNAGVFHTVGFLAHAANVLTVFAILRLLLRRLGVEDAGGRASAVGALLFGLHPMQVESVAWITGNNNVFGGLFGLAAIYVYLRAATRDDTTGGSERRLLCGATLLYALALLAKPTATALPLIVVALETMVLRRPWRRWAGVVGLWLVGAALFGLLTSAGADHARDIVTPLYQRPFVLGDALAFYLVKLVWPAPLCLEYDHGIARVVGSWWGYATFLLPLGLALLLWRLGPKASPYRAGFALLVAGALPMLGLVPYYFQPISTVADRYLYLAMLGPGLVAAVLASRAAAHRSELARALPLIALVSLAVVSARQIQFWRDPMTLARHNLAVSARSYLTHNEMGNLLMERHEWAGAESQYRAALVCNPDFELAHACLGTILEQEGRRAEAADEWSRYVHTSPNDPDAQFAAARLCFTYGKPNEAMIALRRTLELRPDYPGARELGTAIVVATQRSQDLQGTQK